MESFSISGFIDSMIYGGGGIRRIEGRLGMKIRESLEVASLLPSTHTLGEVAKVSYDIGI